MKATAPVARAGSTAAIAERLGYSERTVYRAIALLRSRLGVSSRSHLVALAIRWGIHEEATWRQLPGEPSGRHPPPGPDHMIVIRSAATSR